MQITLPDELNLPARARAAGFPGAAEYVAALVRRAPAAAELVAVPATPGPADAAAPSPGLPPAEPGDRTGMLTRAEWKREFDAVVASAEARGGHGGFVDCSRESIYRPVEPPGDLAAPPRRDGGAKP